MATDLDVRFNDMKKKYPVIKGKTDHYPQKPLCPWCKKHKVLEPHSMAILSGGALTKKGRDHYSGPSNNLNAYLSLTWHGAHDKGEGNDREIGYVLNIAEDVKGGLFDLMFCSTKCLRSFLNACVDELEKQINKTNKRI